MKKKTVKKLVLAKETVRGLAGDELDQVLGATMGSMSDAFPCFNTMQPSCPG